MTTETSSANIIQIKLGHISHIYNIGHHSYADNRGLSISLPTEDLSPLKSFIGDYPLNGCRTDILVAGAKESRTLKMSIFFKNFGEVMEDDLTAPHSAN